MKHRATVLIVAAGADRELLDRADQLEHDPPEPEPGRVRIERRYRFGGPFDVALELIARTPEDLADYITGPLQHDPRVAATLTLSRVR